MYAKPFRDPDLGAVLEHIKAHGFSSTPVTRAAFLTVSGFVLTSAEGERDGASVGGNKGGGVGGGML